MPNSQAFDSVFFLIVLIILLLQLRTRRVRLFGLVIMPLIMLFLTLSFVAVDMPTDPAGIALLAVGFMIGIGIGLVIGSLMEVKVDEKDGSMVLKGSILAVLVWAVIIGLKIYGKDWLGSSGLIDWNLLASIFLMVTVGTMMARRGFVYWRYWQMKKIAPASEAAK